MRSPGLPFLTAAAPLDVLISTPRPPSNPSATPPPSPRRAEVLRRLNSPTARATPAALPSSSAPPEAAASGHRTQKPRGALLRPLRVRLPSSAAGEKFRPPCNFSPPVAPPACLTTSTSPQHVSASLRGDPKLGGAPRTRTTKLRPAPPPDLAASVTPLQLRPPRALGKLRSASLLFLR